MGLVRSSRVSNFGNINTLKKVHGFKRFHLSPIILILKVVLIVLIFFAATNTVEIFKQKPALDTDFLIVLDASSSMSNPDYAPTRLDAAKKISVDWVRTLPKHTQVGYLAFSEDIIQKVEISSDKKEILSIIKKTKIDYSKSGTSADFALLSAINMLQTSPSNNKSILYLTDGTEGLRADTLAIANNAEVQINVFGIGANQYINLDNIPEEFKEDYLKFEQDSFNFSVLQNIAIKTGADAYHVQNETGLQQSFEDATLENVNIKLNTGYYLLILIAIISIAELFIYSKVGGI